MNKKYYIAYGSNLNLAQMRQRCPSARVVGTAVIKDYRLLFKGSGTGAYLTIEPQPGGEVPVVIWAVTPDDERSLDRYEGFPNFYYKKTMVLDVLNNLGITSTKTAFVYIMHEERHLGVPSRYYLETCLEGYRSFGFDIQYLYDAFTVSRRANNGKRG